jgi:hypothetical protein
MEYIVVLVTAYFRYQRPEGALAGGSRKSDSIHWGHILSACLGSFLAGHGSRSS